MALLIDNRPDGHGGQISADLVAAMERVQSQMGASAEEDAVFDLARSRRNIALRAELAAQNLTLPRIETIDRQIAVDDGRITLRTYAPASTGPVIIFVHGGGWMAGSLDTHDSIARWFAAETGAAIVAPAYSLAPEHPFPQAVLDVTATIAAVRHELEPGRRIFVMGDSAGANIAAMAILRLSPAQRAGIAGFISIYGAYAPDMGLSSHRLYGDGRFGLSESRMRWCWTLYAPQLFPDRLDEMTPLGKDLSDFPPTLCIGAECDVLLDDSMSLYGQLAGAAVDVSLSLWPGLSHGCLHYVGVVDSVTNAARSIVRYIASRRAAAPRAVDRLSAARHDPISGPEEVLRDVSQFFNSPRTRPHGTIAYELAMEIVSGRLAPMQGLPTEQDASSARGVSRSAYREAMRTLSAKGLVTLLPKVGTRVAPRERWNILDPDILAWSFEAQPSDQFVCDVFELRGVVEPNAAAIAAGRRDEADIERLAAAVSRLTESNPDSIAWLDATTDFHRTLLLASRNVAFAGLWPAIHMSLRWAVKLRMTLPTLQLAHDPSMGYASIVHKLKASDEIGVRAEMAELVRLSLVDALANLARIRRAGG